MKDFVKNYIHGYCLMREMANACNHALVPALTGSSDVILPQGHNSGQLCVNYGSGLKSPCKALLAGDTAQFDT